MDQHPAAYANICITVTPFEDHSVVTCWLREPGGDLRRLGSHRSLTIRIGRKDLLITDADACLMVLCDAIASAVFNK